MAVVCLDLEVFPRRHEREYAHVGVDFEARSSHIIGPVREVRLDQVLERLPSGLPLPVACWVIGRAASAIAARPRVLTPADLRIREDGAVRVDTTDAPIAFGYKAPEIIRGGGETPRSAVFALGAILVEALTGRPAFTRVTDMETRIAVVEESVARLHGRVAQASPALDQIVARALAKQPNDRFASTVELAEHLDGFLDDELHEVGPSETAAAVAAALQGADVREAVQRATNRPVPASPEPIQEAPPREPEPEPEALPRPVPTPPPPAPEPEPAAPPRDDGAAAAILGAELDLRPETQRRSAPNKPRFDQGLVRVHDPHQGGGGAGITDASVTGVRDSSPHGRRTAAGVLDIDERALEGERQRPITVMEEPEPEPGPNWIKRIGLLLVVLLALAIAWQYALRPLLKP